MARAATADRAKQKAQREKKLAIGLSVVLVAILAVEGPKTMKMLSAKPSAPVVTAGAPTTGGTAAPAVSPTATPSVAAPASSLISAVQPTVDAGQLRAFARFASKDPFKNQSGSTAGAGTTPTPAAPPAPKTPPAPPTPPAPLPTSAVISLNGELGAVAVGSDFPTAGTVFSRAGGIFHLVSLTKSSAKVTINGGSYASGAPALTLTVGKPVTLQNTADGTRYTLLLEPQGTPIPAPPVATAPPVTTPSVVPAAP